MESLSIKDLLKGAVKRARIGRQISAVSIVDEVNSMLKRFLPSSNENDAKCISYKNGYVLIYTINSSASQALSYHKDEILNNLKDMFPEHKFNKITFRVVRRFPNKEI